MAVTDSLYRLFGVSPTCTDDELRRAYRHALFDHHPDKNPHQVTVATVKTQQLTSAYAELKKRRASQPTGLQSTDDEHGIRITVDGHEFIIQFSFGGGVDVESIANRKASFRDEWKRFHENPSDPISALRLVHAAFRAEQQDSLKDVLLNPVLIDSASLLLSLSQKEDACETLIRWSEVLQHGQREREAIQILEDALDTGMTLPSVADQLRKMHYAWAQYSDPTTGSKATPEIRIKHLSRILELGFKYDYIYKFMAEAYHDSGDDEQARAYLRRAYEINPELSGAVRISRALGLSKSPEPSLRKAKPRRKYKYSRPEQIPSSAQIHEWAHGSNWDAVIEFANPHDYSPRIRPKARAILHQIASSLEGCRDPNAIQALITLLNSDYYWDVSEAAMTSLSKIGDKRTLHLLKEFTPKTARGHAHWEMCISYLRARVRNERSSTTTAAPRKSLAQAEKAFAKENYGQARILLESLLMNMKQSDSRYLDAAVLLARSCAEMNDFGTAVELIGPLVPKLPKKSQSVVYREVTSWLWNDLLFQEYDPNNDESYRLALETHLELALMAKTPDDVLGNLRSLTRWLELLGADSIAQWIRQLIRIEAPGTWYVDRQDREQYVCSVDLSPYMKDYLSSIDKRVKAGATAKLKQALRSAHTLDDGELLLDDG